MSNPIPPSPSTLDARRASADLEIADDGSWYRFVRVFGASPERVFRAFTEPADLRVWFPAGAPPGSEMTICESDAVVGGAYRYVMTVPEFGEMSWFGTYTAVDRPHHLGADEWFVMGPGEPSGPGSRQTLDFRAIADGLTEMTMRVELAEPEDPDTLREQAGAGLGSSLAELDALVSPD
ncbi:MAG: SRPBCC domain-containing protein [Actinomycetota bacterium]